MFEYYTFLHHSQTSDSVSANGNSLNTIRFYIILKQAIINRLNSFSFEYYTFLHHSQTPSGMFPVMLCLNTIRFYIILKQESIRKQALTGLNTIRFYIILKPQIQK